ncbi:MAG TPA: ATP-binding protein [Methylomirabilota bacterium]|nr:ATP-binding protein [Methylomirabilota bacterium]
MQFIPKEFLGAWQEYDREITIRKTRLGCFLGIVMVPLFGGLDHFVYPQQAFSFFLLRLVCSALMAGLYFVLGTDFGKKHYHFQGVVLLFLPSATIAWMVYATEGTASPYYAGLILVLMVLAVVLDWTFWQSVISVALVLFLYLAACLFSQATFDGRLFKGSLFFLVSSSIAIIAGTYFHSRVRMREFVSRCELDKSGKALEASLKQLKENEMQLVQSEKLASLGRMSAGIIHEINNPLNFAMTGLFTLRKKSKHLAPEEQADYTEVLTDVEKGLKRVQTIVSDLRMFTHPNTEQLDAVTPAEVVAPALRFLNNEWRDTMQVEQKYAEDQTILANKNKLIHVMVNLFQNSLDSLKTKSFAPGEKPAIWIEGRIENGQSILSVRDNGHGIEAKHLDKIFDPFFTTKDVGEGMGLGLSICYSIVQEYGGKISVKTEPGKFCEFALEFPVKINQAVN